MDKTMRILESETINKILALKCIHHIITSFLMYVKCLCPLHMRRPTARNEHIQKVLYKCTPLPVLFNNFKN